MSSKSPAQRLRDIVGNVDAIEVFTTGMDLAIFTADRKTLYAVLPRRGGRRVGTSAHHAVTAGPIQLAAVGIWP
ncbi:MAG TPA: hypothetical protein VGZ73_15280 [Bryobacteraceae bacterium]|nr:hypothetical protein [Bryobacteraceae bacterium]